MSLILIVDDEPDLASMLADRLRAEGYDVEIAPDGPSGVDAALTGRASLILLDVMLPGFDGFEACRRVRAAGLQTPILMLTARGQISDRVTGLRTGADDYLPKPFATAELLARMEALLRRSPARVVSAASFSDVRVDRERRVVVRSGVTVELSNKEYELLCYLLDRPDKPVRREELLREVWGYERTPNTRTVDVHMAQLRTKLEESPREPRHLLTEHGVGYRFRP